ncbi:MAG: TonB-dependent receptor plug domain-containing protein [Hymenobacter sp.]
MGWVASRCGYFWTASRWNLRPGLGLNALPVSLVERVEVYRGVTPARPGADALGGALNVLTRREQFSYR